MHVKIKSYQYKDIIVPIDKLILLIKEEYCSMGREDRRNYYARVDGMMIAITKDEYTVLSCIISNHANIADKEACNLDTPYYDNYP